MIVRDVLTVLDAIAPPHLAQSWDNVGLLVGDPLQDISRGLLCIDYTAAVADEAKLAGVDFVFTYHPPLFKPLSRITAGGTSALIFDAIRRSVAIYSPHTALDVAEGGTNDVLADVVGLIDRRPLEIVQSAANELKLVTFVPVDHADAVAAAMFAAGAGHIGNYSSCSFRVPGTGTFFGEQGTHPTIGEAGRLEKVDELRLETVLPADRLADVVAALRAVHPYETPSFDARPLVEPPEKTGLGRVGRFETPVARSALFDRIKLRLGLSHLLVAGPAEGIAHTGAVCAGSCGDHVDLAVAAGADVYVTGELKHHDALRAAGAGMTVVCTLHSHSERITLATVARTLREQLPTVQWALSRADRDPFVIR